MSVSRSEIDKKQSRFPRDSRQVRTARQTARKTALRIRAGRALLHEACSREKYEILELLLKLAADYHPKVLDDQGRNFVAYKRVVMEVGRDLGKKFKEIQEALDESL